MHRLRGEFGEAESCWREVLEKRRRTLGEFDPATLASMESGSRRLDAGAGTAPRTPQPRVQSSEADLEFWRSIKDTDDPDDLEYYVGVAGTFDRLPFVGRSSLLLGYCGIWRSRDGVGFERVPEGDEEETGGEADDASGGHSSGST